MTIPAAIRERKPTEFGAAEVHAVSGHFYVYLISSRWDAKRKRPCKVTGKCVGKITEADGFIPNARGRELLGAAAGAGAAGSPAVVRNYGAYELLRRLSPDVEENLRLAFPSDFREIRTLALLRLVGRLSSVRSVRDAFLASHLSEACPDLAMSENPVRRLVAGLGARQDEVDAFLRLFVMPKATLLFDGTAIFWESGDSLSARGYNPDRSPDPQARILYVFDRDSHRPVFYRVLQGSIVDKAAFVDAVRATGCSDCVVIADKGFYSKRNVSALREAGLRYILPLQSNTATVEPAFYANHDKGKWDGVFSYKKRAIWFRKKASGGKGNFIYTFLDSSRRADLEGAFVQRAESDYDEGRHAPGDVAGEVRLGYFSFCSNLDVGAKEIYLSYKRRWDVEQCFDYLKGSVSASASHASRDDWFRGWTFLNHVSLLYFYGLVNALRSAGLGGDYTPEDLLRLTKNIYKVSVDGGRTYSVSAIPEKTRVILTKLGVDLSK